MRWLSLVIFLILIYSSFLSAAYITSTPDEISLGPGALAPIATGAIAVGSIALALKNAKSEVRRSWQMLMIGISLWVIADTIWGAQEIWGLTQEVYFSFADLIWIIGYIPIGAAIWFYLPSLGNLLRDRRKIAVLVVICVLPVVMFGVQLVSTLSSPEIAESGLIVLVPVLYPALDALMAGGGLLIAIYSRHQTWRWPWFLIGGSLVLWAYSDILYALVALNDMYSTVIALRLAVDLSYTLAYLILALGATLSLQSDIFSLIED